ncbi:hypothetical protein MBSD_n0136 [Mizugakiibacter sediminis]|uniref:Dehydrogenase n=1 Tax=Mizugakiibacter sediminis TaxID=1475481 RepID=A0A0K8QJ50_9GAMM|nr:putative peptide maturation dehydrogenase [Mizugakiibacter sediminis]GAP64854.1 hypothetical protein MBSD_n0136 [Mizugakiibacter sediminis]
MRIRRCVTLVIEPRERIEFDLGVLLAGETGVVSRLEWVALAPHLDDEQVLADVEVAALGAISPTQWADREALAQRHSDAVLDGLLAKGLLVGEEATASDDAAARDAALRGAHWRGLSAVAHRFGRWRGIDSNEVERRFAEESDQSFAERLGPPPPHVLERAPAEQRLGLPAAADSPLEALLASRVTCRNFDRTRAVTLAEFGTCLYRAFGARAVSEIAPDIRILKKGSPSAGGLHVTEAYVLVQQVEGIAPGLYHYHPVDHALEPIEALAPDAAAYCARRFVAAQAYYAEAHVQVILASRFRRNFWKYRNHAKAYRAVILDAGHLSQTLYLAATELRLGAFITAAINEVDIEQAFGLEPMEEGPLAVCGFGPRAAQRTTIELDPLGAMWPGGTG